MSEIEVKVLEINQKEMIQELENHGAEKIFDDELHAISFDFPDHRLIDEGILLRLREEGSTNTLGLKKLIHQEGAKTMEEYETKIKNISLVKKIFQKIGLQITDEETKKRTSFIMGKVRFDIDNYEGIPTFMEIEAPSQELIQEWVEKLGITPEKVKPWTRKQLKEHYQRN